MTDKVLFAIVYIGMAAMAAILMAILIFPLLRA